MAVRSDATRMPGGAGRPGGAGQAVAGHVPARADCFTARPHTGPGPLSARPGERCLVLTGSGTGKTQLAAELARTWLEENPDGLLIWLSACSRDSLLSGYAQATAARNRFPPGQAPLQANTVLADTVLADTVLADTVLADTVRTDNAELIARGFLAGLARVTGPWLAVVDGLSDPADAEGLWPDGPPGRVVVTAEPGVTAPAWLNPAVFDVGPFSPHEGLAYLTARLSADPDQRLGAVDLIAELGGDPLALAQASAAMASAGMSCRDYYDMYVKRREHIAGMPGGHPTAMAVTWTLSMECADELASGDAPQEVLVLAALLGSTGIPEAVFATPAVADFAARSAGGTDGAGRVRAALASLRDAGLLHIDDGLVYLPSALRAAVLTATPDSLRAKAATAAAGALLEAWPDDASQPPLACTLRACAASLEQAAADTLWEGGAYQVLFRAGRSLDAARITGPAVRHWRAVAAASEQRLGADHEDAQLATARLASAAMAAGLGTEAVALHYQVVETREKYLGADHPRTVAAQADLGAALIAAGQPGDAIGVLENALAACGRSRGAGAADLLVMHDGLGAAYLAAGRHKDAIMMIERALAERERRQGLDHPDAIRTRRQLARAWLDSGHAKNAVKHGARALEGAERVLGPDSLETVEAVTLLASAYHAARRVREAIALFERALADRERMQGADHPETIGVRGNLASAYHSAGRLPSALDLYERTRADCQRMLGADHPDTLAARANLAHAYFAVGRLSDARTLLAATLAECERVLVPGDPLTVAVRDSLTVMARA